MAEQNPKDSRNSTRPRAEEFPTLPTQSGQRLGGVQVNRNQEKSRKSARSIAKDPPMLLPELGSGQRLGGDAVQIGPGPARRKAFADAASKRLRDAKASASVIEHGRPTVEETMKIDDQEIADDEAGFWACGVCTLVNPGNQPRCDACGTERSGGINWTETGF